MNTPRWFATLGAVVAITAAGCTSTLTPTASTASVTPPVSVPASATPIATTVVGSPAPEAPSTATVIMDAPEMVVVRPEDQPHAPETFVVDGDTLTIADRVHRQLVSYRDGHRIGNIAFPDIKIHDMAIRGGNYYFLDDAQTTVHEYALESSSNSLQPRRTLPLEAESDLICWDGDNLVAELLRGNKWVSVTGTGPTTPNPTFSIAGHGFEITDGQHHITIPTRWEPIGIRLLATEGEYSYYEVTDNYTRANAEQVYLSYVYQFDTTGRLVHSYTMTVACDYKPAREIQINQGRVFQLYITEKSVQVLLLAPNP